MRFPVLAPCAPGAGAATVFARMAAAGTTTTRTSRASVKGAALVSLVLLAVAPNARADGLSAEENERLARGETVARPVTLENDERRYVGGITYAVVRASVSELQTLFEDVAAYKNVLPRTKRATLVGTEGLDQLVELRQGNAMIDARYTLRVRHEAWRRDVRFWLDARRPHDIHDAWGYFHVDPMTDDEGGPRSLVTYAVLVDLGPGLVRELFEERLRAVLLSTPSILSRYLVQRRRAPHDG